MKRSLLLGLVIATPVLLASACSDDSSGGGNNYNVNNNTNNNQPDSGVLPDSSTLPDSSLLPDAGTEPDSATQPDSGTEPDGGGSTGTGAIGDPCSSAGDCAAPSGLTADCLTLLLNVFQFPGGYCTASCTPPTDPSDPDPCGPGAICASLAQQPGQCFKTCNDASECRENEGYDCTDPMGMVGQNVCAPPIGI